MVIISVIFALVFFVDSPSLLALYLISTFTLTLILFGLKFILYSRVESEPLEYSSTQSQEKRMKWQIIVLIVAVMVTLGLPLVLLFFNPVGWLIMIDSFVTGVSFSEITVYWYAQKFL